MTDMANYRVDVFLQQVDRNGKIKRGNFSYKFDNKEIPLIQLRRKAIQKAQDVIMFFENEMRVEIKLGSFSETEIKWFKNFTSYQLQVMFSHENKEELVYGGNGEESFDGLASEADYYKKNNEDVDLLTITNSEGNEIEVIKSNIDFFCSTNS